MRAPRPNVAGLKIMGSTNRQAQGNNPAGLFKPPIKILGSTNIKDPREQE